MIYGSVKLADVSPAHIDIYIVYNNGVDLNNQVTYFNGIDLLTKVKNPIDTNLDIDGLYNLQMPQVIFNQKGFYNVLIQPKQIKLKIVDCGILFDDENIKGIVLDSTAINSDLLYLFQNDSLSGYIVEYIDSNTKKKIENTFRVITTNFKVEPVLGDILKYRMNDNANLVFCVVTPSSNPLDLPNLTPFIGYANQEIIIKNTFFDAQIIPIEITEHDIDSLAIGIYGNQTKSIKDGIRTYYDEQGNIFKQYDEYVQKDDFTDESLYDVRKERIDIDFTKINIIN